MQQNKHTPATTTAALAAGATPGAVAAAAAAEEPVSAIAEPRQFQKHESMIMVTDQPHTQAPYNVMKYVLSCGLT